MDIHYIRDYTFALDILIDNSDPVLSAQNKKEIISALNFLNSIFIVPGIKCSVLNSLFSAFKNKALLESFTIRPHTNYYLPYETDFQFKIGFQVDTTEFPEMKKLNMNPFLLQLSELLYKIIHSPVGINYLFYPSISETEEESSGLVFSDSKGSRVLYTLEYTDDDIYSDCEETNGEPVKGLKFQEDVEAFPELYLKKEGIKKFIRVPNTGLNKNVELNENCIIEKDLQLSKNGKTLEKYIGKQKFVRIPDTVKRIAERAFECCETVKKVLIPSSVNEIGACAFYNCTSLVDISLPSSIYEINQGTFGNCTSLKNIAIPYSVEFIRYRAFEACTSLKKIKIPENIKHVDADAFLNCSGLEEIYLTDSMKWIAYSIIKGSNITHLKHPALTIENGMTIMDGTLEYYCTDGKKNLEIPDTVKKLSHALFFENEHIETVKIPDSVKLIGSFAFSKCKMLREVTIPDSVYNIEADAFSGCESLKNVVLPKHLVCIKESTFRDCTSLESVIIPDSVLIIKSEAFKNCPALKTINIPSSVQMIANDAFDKDVKIQRT